MQKYYIYFFLFISAFIINTSCGKEDDSNEANLIEEVYMAEDETFANWLFMEIVRTAFGVNELLYYELNPGLTSTDTSGLSNTCPIISYSSTDNIYPKTITLDYGTKCTDWSLNTRSNQITIEVSGSYPYYNDTMIISLDSFIFNDIVVDGDILISNTKTDSLKSIHGYSRINIENSYINSGDSIILSRNGEYIYFWENGADTTATTLDDFYTIEGSATGNHSVFGDFTSTINDSLIGSLDCQFIKRGIVSLQFDGKPELELNFGYGSCENQGKVTSEGKTDEFYSRYSFLRHKD